MQIAIFIACCFIIGMLIVVCLELRHLREDVHTESDRLYEKIEWCESNLFEYGVDEILEQIPDTFEYNGMRGKVFTK